MVIMFSRVFQSTNRDISTNTGHEIFRQASSLPVYKSRSASGYALRRAMKSERRRRYTQKDKNRYPEQEMPNFRGLPRGIFDGPKARGIHQLDKMYIVANILGGTVRDDCKAS